MAKSLAELAIALDISPKSEWESIPVAGICEDTRRLVRGALFVAIPGHQQDGTAYIDQAIERGAIGVVAEHAPASLPVPVLRVPAARTALARLAASFYDHPTSELFTVGVTGTNGKTTVCHWVADVLGRSDTRVVTTVSSVVLGFPGLTTPPSPTIQAFARDAVIEGAHNLVIEASSAGIEQERTASIDFDVCVFTNLSLEHVRHHQGWDAYRKAKLKLFEGLKRDAWAVVNADDPMAKALMKATPARIVTYGLARDPDVRASNIALSKRSSQFTVHVRGQPEACLRLPLSGHHNVSNALAALGVATIAGVPLFTILERLSHAAPIPGRSCFFRRSDGRLAVVDFAHNGASLDALLSSLHANFHRLIVVFGCPGDGEKEKRKAMGKAAARWADRVVLTADNPKEEDPASIAKDILLGIGTSRIPVCMVVDRAQAIDAAIEQATSGDLIVLAGKGHERDQIVGHERLPFSDSDALRSRGFVADSLGAAC